MMESSNKKSKKASTKEIKTDEKIDETNNQEKENINIEEKDNIQVTKPDEKAEEKYFSEVKFSDMPLSKKTLEALDGLNYTTATKIQAECIPKALEGQDIIGSAKTGSGKSLAFLIPCIELISKQTKGKKEVLRALIITPTRELALQLYNLTRDLLGYYDYTCALIIGGANRKVEAEKLKQGVSLIVATPGRLLDHMSNTKGFNFDSIGMLVVDEADAILQIGFEKELKQILDLLTGNRQTLLFSATITPKVEDIIKLSMKDSIYIGIKSENTTVNTLQQGYVVVSPEKKFLLLYTFIRKNLDKKIMVFFSSCKSVEFYSYLLNYVDIPVKSIHGGHKQQKRSTTYLEFVNSSKGVLLCTDVAQRGLDIPDVDWIIQYDPPHSNIILTKAMRNIYIE
jgi:ATP-dependent RNA helicase DDX18/HAS1